MGNDNEAFDTVVTIPREGVAHRRSDFVRQLSEKKGDASLWNDLATACLRDDSLDDATAVLTAFRDAQTEETTDADTGVALALLQDLQRQWLFRPEADRKAELEAIRKTATTAAAVARNDLLPALHEGLLELLKGDSEKAEALFSQAAGKKHRRSHSLLPFISLGISSFRNRDYAKAMAYLSHVLKRMGSEKCPAEIRVAIGFCFFHQGKLDAAISIFERNREHLGATYGLIAAYLRKYTTQFRRRREHLQRVLEAVRELLKGEGVMLGGAFQSVVMILLARLALVCGDASAAAHFSERAMKLSSSDSIHAQASLLHARAHHAMGHFTEATRDYSHALAVKPDLALARYGLSQMHIASGNLRNGATSLEQIVLLFLKDPSAESLISKPASHQLPLDQGSISNVTHHHAGAAVKLFQSVSSQMPFSAKERSWLSPLFELLTQTDIRHSSPETFVALGELMTKRDQMEAFKLALELYKKQRLKATNHNQALNEAEIPLIGVSSREVPQIPLHVHNNAAAAFYEMYKEKDSDWQWCLQAATEHAKRALALYNEEKPRLSKVTLLFNRARTLEETKFYTQAAAIYKEIMQSAPQYIEAHLQLMVLFRKMGRLDLAIAQGKESVKAFSHSPIVKSVLAALCLEDGNYDQCKRYLDSVLKDGHPKDVHSLVLSGILWLRTAPTDLRLLSSDSTNRDRARRHWKHALELFTQALTVDPHCLYAAQGASAMIGEFGRCIEIPKLYESIVDVASRQHWAASPWSFVNPISLPAAEVNLGHLWFAKRQFSHAAKLYEYATELYKAKGPPDPTAQTFAARAQYESRTRFTESALALRRLTHLQPWDKATRFNLALVLQGAGVHFILHFKIPAALPDDSPLEQFRSAIDSLDHALVLYQGLKLISEEALPYKHALIDDQIQICHDYKKKGEEAFQSISALLEKQAFQDQINRREWEAHLIRQEEERRQKEEEKRLLDAEQEERVRQHLKERAEKLAIQAAMPEPPKPKRKRSRSEKRRPQGRGRAFTEALNRYTIGDIKEEDSASQGDVEMEDAADLGLDDEVEDEAEPVEGLQEVKARRRTLLSDDEDSS